MPRIPRVKYSILKEIETKGSVTVSDIESIDASDYKSSEKDLAGSQLHRYKNQGLIKKVDSEPTRGRTGSKFVYGLTDHGKRRLEFFDKVKEYQDEGMNLYEAWDRASEEMS